MTQTATSLMLLILPGTLLAVLLFAAMDAGLKPLAPYYPVMQVAALRGLSSLLLIVIWALSTVPLTSL